MSRWVFPALAVFVLLASVAHAAVTVNLIAPTNASWNNSATMNFTFYVNISNSSEGASVLNTTLFIRNTTGGAWNTTFTNSTAPVNSNVSSNFIVFPAIPVGNYTWSVLAWTNDSNVETETFASSNFTLFADSAAPASFALSSSTPANNSFVNGSFVPFNVTFTEANPVACMFSFSNTTGPIVNSSMTLVNYSSTAACSYNVSSLEAGTHNYSVYANDSAGNAALSGAYFFTVDPYAPQFNASSVGTNSTVVGTPGVQLNFTANWTSHANLSHYIFSWNGSGAECGVWANDTAKLLNGTRVANGSGWTNAIQTIPAACAGKTIWFQFYVNNTAGNWNATPLNGGTNFTLYVFPDNVTGSFVFPQNNSNASFPVAFWNNGMYWSNVTILFNANTSVGTLANATLWMNGSGTMRINATNMTNGTGPVNASTFNMTAYNITDGFYNWTVTVCNSLSACTNTSIQFLVDNEKLNITNVSISPITNNSGLLTWNTQDVLGLGLGYSNATIEFGTSTAYGTNYTNATFDDNHSINFTGLAASTSYYFRIWACDYASNCNSTTGSFQTADTTGGGSGSGSGGSSGSGSGSATTTTVTTSTTTTTGGFQSSGSGGTGSVSGVQANEEVVIQFPSDIVEKTGVTEIHVTFNKAVADAKITVTRLASRPSGVKELNGTVHTWLSFTIQGFTDADVKSASVSFRAKKADLKKASAVSLYRYTGTEWRELATSIDSQDTTYYVYVAQTPGFSYFAIAEDTSGTSASGSGSGEELPALEELDGGMDLSSVIILVIILGALGGSYVYLSKKK